MYTMEQLISLIDDAAAVAGSQRKLAALLDIEHANLVKIKKGERPANWRVRGKLRAILGDDPAHAFMSAMAEDLEQSEQTDEKKAADGFKAMLAAFPDGWRKRMLSTALALATLQIISRLGSAINSTFDNRDRHSELHA